MTEESTPTRNPGSRFCGVIRRDARDDSRQRLADALAGSHYGRAASPLHEFPHLVLSSDLAAPCASHGQRSSDGPQYFGFSGWVRARGSGAQTSDAAVFGAAQRLARELASGQTNSIADRQGAHLMVVVDRERNQATLMRDRTGIRPLFYARVRDRLWFSDHIGPLLELLPERDMRPQALIEFLHGGCPREPKTFFESISLLPAGHLLHHDLRSGSLRTERYYELSDSLCADRHRELSGLSERALRGELERLLVGAVTNDIGDESRATSLVSGGVDSSVITALAKDRVAIDAVTVDVRGSRGESELPWAQLAADSAGMPLAISAFDGEAYRGTLCETVQILGSPTIVESAGGLYHAAANGSLPRHQRIVSGEGSDAIFAGSVSLFRLDFTTFLLSRMLPISDQGARRMVASFRRAIERVGIRTSTRGRRGLDLLLGIRLMETTERDRRMAAAAAHLPEGTERDITLRLLEDFQAYSGPIVARLDPVAGVLGTEMCLPFHDPDLIDFAINLPLRMKLGFDWRRMRPQGKWLLKRFGERVVPPEVIWRKKGGFDIPGGDWVGGLPEKWIEDSWVASQFGVDRAGLRSWLEDAGTTRDLVFLASMEIWGRLFALGQPFCEVKQQWLQAGKRD